MEATIDLSTERAQRAPLARVAQLLLEAALSHVGDRNESAYKLRPGLTDLVQGGRDLDAPDVR